MLSTKQHEQSFAQYPSQKDHEQAWEELAQNIAALKSQITDDPEQFIDHSQLPSNAPQKTGELIIIGSGIETVGFTATDEKIIQDADKVFYCVADPATNVWLKSLRPDAYDLYVLYDESKVRYITYMQMTEAMLYYMRQGQKVVGIYYGHPGIFVLSTHRAIQIARREGYRAAMRAGISALDTLCADLGVDPSQPGMQTFEATDMLIRARVPDIHVHVVLWQVGLVGELGYRRQGFLNSGFPILLEYLQKYYGKDYPVTNYIGSRYLGIEPIMDVYTLQQLYEPEIQQQVTGISTFYLAPKQAAIADEDMMRRLGLLKTGMKPKQPTNPLREIDRYGAREMEAFRHFESFKIPRDYQWQEDTAAARFILSLKDDPELRSVYSSSPELALSNGHSSALSDWEKLMLKKRTAGAMQLAAKGYSLKSKRSNNSQFVHDLFCQKVLAKSLQRNFKHQKNILANELEKWSSKNGYNADIFKLINTWKTVTSQELYPWSGIYLCPNPQFIIFILGNTKKLQKSRIYVNGQLIQNWRFIQGRMEWSQEDGNAHSGYLTVNPSLKQKRQLEGLICSDSNKPTANATFIAQAIEPVLLNLCHFIGEYTLLNSQANLTISLHQNNEYGPKIIATYDGQESEVKLQNQGFVIAGQLIPFGDLQSKNIFPKALQVTYKVRVADRTTSAIVNFDLSEELLKIAGQAVKEQKILKNTLVWTGGPAGLETGEFSLSVDPLSLLPMGYGKAGATQDKQPLKLTGMKPSTPGDLLLKNSPNLNLPSWAWDHLLQPIYEASDQGGLFVWNAWERHHLTYQILQMILSKLT
jgi:hypothetical protein